MFFLDDTSRLLDEVLLKVVSDISRDSVETKKKKHRKPHLHRKRYHEKGKKHSPSKEGLTYINMVEGILVTD